MINTTLENATGLLSSINRSIANSSANASIAGAPVKQGFALFHRVFGPVLDPPFMILILSASLIIALLIFLIRGVAPMSHFVYANARIQARSNFMVSGRLMEELAEARSLKEFRSLLKETAYEEELEKSREGLRDFHIALEASFISSVRELVGLSPKQSKSLFSAYLMFFESQILKTIYRAKRVGSDIDSSLIYPIGALEDSLIKHLLDAKSTADMKVILAPTAYSKIFEKEYESLEEFEVSIDQLVFSNFAGIVNKIKIHDKKLIMDILNKKIDMMNIIALLKFRARGIGKERQEDLLIKNGSGLCSRAKKAIEAESLEDFVASLEGLPYHAPLDKALESFRKDGSLSHFEEELYRFFKKTVISHDLSHTMGPYPLFSYLTKKELELKNLFIVSKGIDSGLTDKKIKERII
ncbi:V-type ATPase subunit [Candidatus Woesearchaeota archaeon]|nr:V-type ATPase subunit [Candidatus Woesearchaeota archaeon]